MKKKKEKFEKKEEKLWIETCSRRDITPVPTKKTTIPENIPLGSRGGDSTFFRVITVFFSKFQFWYLLILAYTVL